MTPIWSDAIHEAGHVIMLLHGSLTFDYVTVQENSNGFGHVHRGTAKRFIGEWSLDTLQREVAAALGGVEAQRIDNTSTEDEIIEGGQQDLESARKWVNVWVLARQSTTLNTDDYIESVRRETENTIKNNWSDVNKVAKALMEFQKLTYSETLNVLKIE